MFDDMMSSSRGPGLIGTLLALLVLVGFGSLYLFVFDEEMQGKGQSIESAIRDQKRKIDSLNGRVEAGSKQLEDAPARIKRDHEFAALTRRLGESRAKAENLKASTESLGKDIDALRRKFDDYKDLYRAQVRGEAAGIQYDELKTVSGRTFQKVVVKKVDAVGMNFQHVNGTGRADFDDLPAEVQDFFQYDPKQKELAKQQEAAAHQELSQQVAVVQAQVSKQQQEQAAREKEELRQKNTAELASLQSLVSQLDGQIANEQRAWSRERESVRRNGGVLDSAGYQTRLSSLRTRRATAANRIAELQRALGS
jgi:chromosome segregation ATPase